LTGSYYLSGLRFSTEQLFSISVSFKKIYQDPVNIFQSGFNWFGSGFLSGSWSWWKFFKQSPVEKIKSRSAENFSIKVRL
jgi:hypothetical protein